MKKIIYAAIAAIGLWLSPGCSNEEELLGSGDEAQVSFTVNLADGIQTKAADDQIAQGLKAKNLVVGVFEKNGEEYQEVAIRHKEDNAFSVQGGKIKANVNFKLMKGKSYSFIFWAQSQNVKDNLPTSPYYNLTDLQDIQVSYDGATANDEDRDAFLGVVKDYLVTGNFTKDVELKRPFAQLNFMVTEEELNKAKAAGLTTIEKSSITLSQVASKLQPLKGTVSDYQENVTFAAANVSINMNDITASANKQTLPKYDGTTDTDTYYYLATTYLLVAAGTTDAENSGKDRATLTSANMKIAGAEGNGLTANSVPVQWNYRTNIYGPLLTAPGTFNVEIEEDFAGDYNEYQESVTVNTINEVATAIQNGATTITVKDAPTSDVPIEIPKVVDGDNKNITLNLPAFNSTVTISQATTGTAGTTSPKKVNVNTTSATNVVINLPEATVTLNGGTYTTVTSTTADETLIVSKGVTITDLVVQKGKVRIMKGGKVGTIKRAEGNEDPITYVYIEDGELEHLPTDPNIIVQATIASASAFKSALETACRTVGDHTVSISGDIDFTDVPFHPLSVDGYHGVGVITIEGNGHTFTGLQDALFAGGFAGTSGIVIKDLTIDGKNQPITPRQLGEESGWGYFIKNIDSMPTITLENCHLKNADITITDDLRVGGLIGWTAGYNNENDGPVATHVTITNCSVTNSKITAAGSVGAINGHAGNNAWTFTTITNCNVTGCTLHSTDDGDWRVGVVVGTANVGEVTISGITESGNTVQQDGKTAPEHSNLYGRFVPGTTGKLTIDGVEIPE